MNLAEHATADLAILINDQEFATLASINGAPAVTYVLDDDVTKIPLDGEGVRRWDSTLYVALADMPQPVPDQRITIAGRPANVVSVNAVHGLLTIGLRWWDS